MDKHLEKQTHVVLGKNKQSDKHFKKEANAVWRKMNGQTFPKTAKCSLEKKRTGKHFEKQTKVVLGKHKQTNISKIKKQHAVLRNRASKNEWTNI